MIGPFVSGAHNLIVAGWSAGGAGIIAAADDIVQDLRRYTPITPNVRFISFSGEFPDLKAYDSTTHVQRDTMGLVVAMHTPVSTNLGCLNNYTAAQCLIGEFALTTKDESTPILLQQSFLDGYVMTQLWAKGEGTPDNNKIAYTYAQFNQDFKQRLNNMNSFYPGVSALTSNVPGLDGHMEAFREIYWNGQHTENSRKTLKEGVQEWMLETEH